MSTAIEIRNVRKTFKKRRGKTTKALDGVSLVIEEGELFGLLGPNGAGKTTLVRCLATLLIPDQGGIRIFDRDIFRHQLLVRQDIGLLTSGERTLYWKLSGRDNLKFFSALYGIEPRAADRRIDYLIELMGLAESARDRVERYSSGMRQKLSLARALLHDPKILLLDEPTLGLDPQFSRFIRNFIRQDLNRQNRKTILMTTHYMDEADELCDRIAFIDRGRIVGLDSPTGFKRAIPHEEVLELKCQGIFETDTLSKIPQVEKVSVQREDGITVVKVMAPRSEDILSEVIKDVSAKVKILSIDVNEPTLEDVFIYYTGRTLKGEEEDPHDPPSPQ